MKKSGRLFFVLFISFAFSAVVQAEEKFPIDIHGYLSQGFIYSNHNNYLADTKNGTFQFNELGINFSTELTDKLRMGIQLTGRDLGNMDNDKVTIDWAFADYRWQDWLGIRVGKIKLPTGFYNKTRDIDMLRTFILLPQSIYIETFRDTLTAMKGVGIYGEIPLHSLGNISYEFLGGGMNIDKEGSTIKGVEAQGLFKIENYNVKKTFCGEIIWEAPLEGLRLGVSRLNIDLKLQGVLTQDLTIPVSFPPYTITIAREGDPFFGEVPNFRRTVYSLEYTRRNLVLAAEYFRQDQTTSTRITGMEPMKRIFKFEGFYGSATYRFLDRFETGLYYSIFYKNRDDHDGTKTPYNPTFFAYQKDGCLSFRFDLNDHWTFKLEGHLMNGTGLCFSQDNLDDKGNLDYTRKWHLLAAKMTFSF